MKVYIVLCVEAPEGEDAIDFGVAVANAVVEVANPGVEENFGVSLRVDEVATKA